MYMPFRRLLEYYHTSIECNDKDYSRPRKQLASEKRLHDLLAEYSKIKRG